MRHAELSDPCGNRRRGRSAVLPALCQCQDLAGNHHPGASIVAGLFLGLSSHFITQEQSHKLLLLRPSLTGWPAFSLILMVQGFESSRYLGAITRLPCVSARCALPS